VQIQQEVTMGLTSGTMFPWGSRLKKRYACLSVRQMDRRHATTVRNIRVLVYEFTFPVDLYIS
jgi:hypothetical protein